MKQDNNNSTQDPMTDCRAQLDRLMMILASTQIGTWEIYFEKGKDRLLPDDRMKEILGITSSMTPEEIFELYDSRIHPQDKASHDLYVQKLAKGMRCECTYRWVHPRLGVRWMRSGGARVLQDAGDEVLHANGFLYDVTDQITKEIRSNQIIKSFARTYEFINYVNLSDDSFFTYTEKEIEDETLIKVLMAGSATKAIEIGLEEIVGEAFRDEMRTFTDLSTINQRMATCNVLVDEYKDKQGVWHEFSYTVADRRSDGTISNLLWANRLIENEKQNELRKQKLLEDTIEANKAKTKFLQNMSHEIRTPLNALFGFAQLLGLPEGSNTEEEREQYNGYIYSSYQMLDMLIRDIIEVAGSEHGNYQVSISDVILADVCRNAMASVEYRVPSAVKAYFTTDCPDGFMIRSDGRRIQQVLINFLVNACKYTEKGEIHLHCSCTERPGSIALSVADTGTGIPESKAKVIFNRFTKLNDYVQGSGLGLNICQTIAEKLGGRVYLDTAYTQGARFVFEVPVAPL